MVNTVVMPSGPLSTEQERHFTEVCADARTGFRNAIDLVLIHNERTVRGNQPRTTLNPLTVLLAVSAWERFVVDLRALALGEWGKPGLARPDRRASRVAWLGHPNNPARPGHAQQLIAELTGHRLPGSWMVRSFDGWAGTRPQVARELSGTAPVELADQVDAWIRLRNAVAHRALAQDEAAGPYFESDAANSHTIQAGWARTVLAVFLQLTDQAIVAVAAAAGFARATRHRLPAQWFAGDPPAVLRGVTEPGALWGGYALHRP